jgi:hypothetical protein
LNQGGHLKIAKRRMGWRLGKQSSIRGAHGDRLNLQTAPLTASSFFCFFSNNAAKSGRIDLAGTPLNSTISGRYSSGHRRQSDTAAGVLPILSANRDIEPRAAKIRLSASSRSRGLLRFMVDDRHDL